MIYLILMFNLLKFYTVWNIILVLFKNLTIYYFDIHLSTLFVFLCGFYLSFIYPKYYIFILNNKKIKITGWLRFIIVDIIFHTIPLIYIINIKYEYNKQKILNQLILFFIYLFFNNIFHIYNIRLIDYYRLILFLVIVFLN